MVRSCSVSKKRLVHPATGTKFCPADRSQAELHDTDEMTIRESSLSVEADKAAERNRRDVVIADKASAGNTPTVSESLYASPMSPAKELESIYVNMTTDHKMVNPFSCESSETVEYVNARSYLSSPDSDNVYHVPRPTVPSSTSMYRLLPVGSENDESNTRLMSKLSVSPEAQSTSEYAMTPATTPDSEYALSSSSENLNASSGSDGSMTRGSGSRTKAVSQFPRRPGTKPSLNFYENELQFNLTEKKQAGQRSVFLNHKHDTAAKSRSVPAGLSPTLTQVVEEGTSTDWSSFRRNEESHTPVLSEASASMASPVSLLKPRPVQQPQLVQAEDRHHVEEDGEERIYEEIRDSSPVTIETVEATTPFRPRPRPNTLDLCSSQMKTSQPVLIPGRRACPAASSPKEETLQKQAEFVKLHHMLHAQKLHPDGFLWYEQAWDGRPVIVQKHAGIGARPKSNSLSPSVELDRHGIKNHQYLTQFSCVIPTKHVMPERMGKLQRAISLQDLRTDNSLNERNPRFQRGSEATSFERDRGKSDSAGETKPRKTLSVRESLRLREPKSKHLAYDSRKPDSDETARKVISKKERMQIEASDYRRNNWDRFDDCMRSKRLEKDRAKRPAPEIGWPMDLQSMSTNKQKELTDMIKEIRKVLPDAKPAECLEGLRHSGDRPDDAVGYVLVKRLSSYKYGFSFEQCKKVLSDCHGDFDEAKRSLKAQYLCDRFRELDQSQCMAVLRETDWNLVASVKKIYVQNCKAIGVDLSRGNAILAECGNNVTRAIEAMKVARVTEITGRPEDECFKTLSLCQWNLVRAVDLILTKS